MSDDIQRLLGRLEAKIDELLKSRDSQDEQLLKLSDRVTALEQWKWKAIGAASALGAAGTVAAQRFWGVISSG